MNELVGLADVVEYVQRAVISDCGLYRYWLLRRWGKSVGVSGYQPLVFVMLNPSVADGTKDDPTIRRCRGFATRFGYEGFDVVNLFAFRATKPTALKEAQDPIGPSGDKALLGTCRRGDKVVLAWGTGNGVPKKLMESRIAQVEELLGDLTLYRLGKPTQDGMPCHPLMLRSETDLEVHRLPTRPRVNHKTPPTYKTPGT